MTLSFLKIGDQADPATSSRSGGGIFLLTTDESGGRVCIPAETVGILQLAESHVLLAAREQQQLFRDGANDGQTIVPRNSQLFYVKVGYWLSFFVTFQSVLRFASFLCGS
jgi:hypothetical protein